MVDRQVGSAAIHHATEKGEESTGDGVNYQVVRITIEFLRPVPVAPLHLETMITRPGRRAQEVEARLVAGNMIVAAARAVRIATKLPDDTNDPLDGEPMFSDAMPDPPELGITTTFPPDAAVAFHASGAELRFVDGEFGSSGPATVWIRLRQPVVEGEAPSPLQRVAAAADFGNGVSAELTWGEALFINPDLTIYLHRQPVDEWVCLQARTFLGPPGIGIAESALWDRVGRIGRSLQSLVVERRRT